MREKDIQHGEDKRSGNPRGWGGRWFRKAMGHSGFSLRESNRYERSSAYLGGIRRLHPVFLAIIGTLLLFQSSVSEADQSVVVARDTSTVVDLMDTDLVKKKNMLDCELRLEGNRPHYKLVYSLGEIPVPEKSVMKIFGRSHFLLAVRGRISSIPVEQLFVRYHEGGTHKYRLGVTCRKGYAKCVSPIAYEMLIDQPEERAFQKLQSSYSRDLLVSGTYDPKGDVNPGAILISDRPNLVSPAMDGLPGARNKRKTSVHYACGTLTDYWK